MSELAISRKRNVVVIWHPASGISGKGRDAIEALAALICGARNAVVDPNKGAAARIAVRGLLVEMEGDCWASVGWNATQRGLLTNEINCLSEDLRRARRALSKESDPELRELQRERIAARTVQRCRLAADLRASK